jgi:hypothetical protein
MLNFITNLKKIEEELELYFELNFEKRYEFEGLRIKESEKKKNQGFVSNGKVGLRLVSQF